MTTSLHTRPDDRARGLGAPPDAQAPPVRRGRGHGPQRRRKAERLHCPLEPWHADIEEFLELRLSQARRRPARATCSTPSGSPTSSWTGCETTRSGPCSAPTRLRAQRVPRCSWTCTPGTRRRSATSGGQRPRPLAQTARLPGRDRRALHALQGRLQRKVQPENLGTIKSSNLCTEVVEYSSKDEVAVCNLASLSLPAFVGEDRCFDYADFHATVKLATKNLNRVIDRNMYPVEEAQRSNERHRPIGLGVQGLADASSRCTSPTTRQKGSPSTERSSK